jgi:hypothetical protein
VDLKMRCYSILKLDADFGDRHSQPLFMTTLAFAILLAFDTHYWMPSSMNARLASAVV